MSNSFLLLSNHGPSLDKTREISMSSQLQNAANCCSLCYVGKTKCRNRFENESASRDEVGNKQVYFRFIGIWVQSLIALISINNSSDRQPKSTIHVDLISLCDFSDTLKKNYGECTQETKLNHTKQLYIYIFIYVEEKQLCNWSGIKCYWLNNKQPHLWLRG
jgi:hypothetical protein